VSDIHYVYILSEDDNDDLFYQFCLNKLASRHHEIIHRKIRKNGGVSAVKSAIRTLVKDINRTGYVDNTFFLIALDNDRSPTHPEHKKSADFSKLSKADQKKTCRYCDLEKVVVDELGHDRQQWPIKGAIAVPVQMIETWLLLIANPNEHGNEQQLPSFAEQSSASARDYYKSNPPKQLKDLKKDEKKRLGIETDRQLCEYCAEQLNPADLSQRSPSFQRLMDEIINWGQP
jgi:hypothetical protein